MAGKRQSRLYGTRAKLAAKRILRSPISIPDPGDVLEAGEIETARGHGAYYGKQAGYTQADKEKYSRKEAARSLLRKWRSRGKKKKS